jgi:hypothetical protein
MAVLILMAGYGGILYLQFNLQVSQALGQYSLKIQRYAGQIGQPKGGVIGARHGGS